MNQFRLMLALAGLLMIPGVVGYCEEMAQPSAEGVPAEHPQAGVVKDAVAHQEVLAGVVGQNLTEAPSAGGAVASSQGPGPTTGTVYSVTSSTNGMEHLPAGGWLYDVDGDGKFDGHPNGPPAGDPQANDGYDEAMNGVGLENMTAIVAPDGLLYVDVNGDGVWDYTAEPDGSGYTPIE